MGLMAWISNPLFHALKTTDIITKNLKNYQKSLYRVSKRDVLAYPAMHLTQLKGIRPFLVLPEMARPSFRPLDPRKSKVGHSAH